MDYRSAIISDSGWSCLPTGWPRSRLQPWMRD